MRKKKPSILANFQTLNPIVNGLKTDRNNNQEI